MYSLLPLGLHRQVSKFRIREKLKGKMVIGNISLDCNLYEKSSVHCVVGYEDGSVSNIYVFSEVID